MLEQKILWKDKEDSKIVALLDANTSVAECYDFACKFKAEMVQRMVDEQKASEQKPSVPSPTQESPVEPIKGAD